LIKTKNKMSLEFDAILGGLSIGQFRACPVFKLFLNVSFLSLTLFSYYMFLQNITWMVIKIFFWFKFFKNLQLSHVWATYFQKNTGLLRNSLTLISIGLKWYITVPLVLWWQLAFKAAHGRLQTHKFDHWVGLCLTSRKCNPNY